MPGNFGAPPPWERTERPPRVEFDAPKRWGFDRWNEPPTTDDFLFISVADIRGWPRPSMSATLRYGPDANADVLIIKSTGYLLDPLGIDMDVLYLIESAPWETRMLSFMPIFPGFIINTLFYALLLWLLFFAPFAARRMLRRRRGLCEKCAYPIGVSAVCTECGAAVSRNEPRA